MNIGVLAFKEQLTTLTHQLINSSSELAKAVYATGIRYLSPKQQVRPDLPWQCVVEVLPTWRGWLRLQGYKVEALFHNLLPIKEQTAYLCTLSVVLQLKQEGEVFLDQERREAIQSTLELAISSERKLKEWEFFLLTLTDSKWLTPGRTLRDYLKLLDDKEFIPLQNKLKKIAGQCCSKESVEIEEQQKLSYWDCTMLEAAPFMCQLATAFKQQAISSSEELLTRWEFLARMDESPVFVALKQLATQEALRPGTVYLGNRHVSPFFSFPNGYPARLSAIHATHHLFMGLFSHLAIVVKKEGHLCLSGMNGSTQCHAVSPTRHPLTYLFHYPLELDISPLLPDSLRPESGIYTTLFAQAFHGIASEEHPEISLAGFWRGFQMVLFGHKQLTRQPLSQVELPKAGVDTMCSSYVAIVFLKALEAVNEHLKKEGVAERIAHPFGLHENLMHLDTLRLLYLWKELKLLKQPDLDGSLGKVIALPPPLPSLFGR